MKEQSRKRKILTYFFVQKPLGFVLFLMLGITAFIVVTGSIKIPVYNTVEAYVEKENDMIRLNLHNQKIQADTPVFLYQSRDDFLEKITEYQMEDGYIVTDDTGVFLNGEKINIDFQTEEVTLLRHILEGGNT